MKKNEDLKDDFKDVISLKPVTRKVETRAISKVSKNLRRVVYIAGLTGMGLFINACTSTGYIETEPVYVENTRPPRPSDLHVWIDGDWVWSRQTNGYIRQDGYWERPNEGRVYITGRWEVSPRGKYWAKGHWQRRSR